MPEKRPAKFTMEGMICTGRDVLKEALDPSHPGIPCELVQKCHGVILLHITTVGLVFSGHGGSGVLMRKSHTTGNWSAPCAVDLTGFGGGLVAGADVKDTITFIMDEETMKDYAKNIQTKFGGEASFTIGDKGRDTKVGFMPPEKGIVTVAFKKGAFAGVGLTMGTLGHCHKINKVFYGKKIGTAEILYDKNVAIPPERGVEDLHEMLAKLEKGETWVPDEAFNEKSERLWAAAEKSAQIELEDDDEEMKQETA
jgi:lipid-binding SYLF domain-containing protein